MASTHKHIRSSTANKRPTTAIADGQIALNTNASSPGLFFKDSTGASIIKIGPVHVGSTAPNATPGAGGSSGNSTGEIWLDNSLTPVGVKIWNGSAWVNATPVGSTTVQGLLELATSAETQTGTDTDRAVTPAGLQSKLSDSTSTTSSTTIASSTAVKAAYDLAAAALPLSGGIITGNLEIGTTGSLSFEGSTADAFETTIAVTNPTADRTITLPDTTGTVVTTGDTGTVTSTMIADGTIVNGDINASAAIAHSKLANITAGQVLLGDASNVPTATALSGDVTVNSSGVTAISSGVIVNADVNASAAIAGTKISPDFGSQTITTTGVVSAALGAAATPSITFTGDTNTGIYSPGADQVAVATNGTGRLFVDASGNVGVGGSPATNLDVFSAATTTIRSYASAGNQAYLSAAGNAGAPGTSAFDIIQDGTSIAYIYQRANQPLLIGTNNIERLRITSTGQLSFIGAGSSGSPAVGFNGSAPSNSLVVDSSGRVGIGTSSPAFALDVSAPSDAVISARTNSSTSAGFVGTTNNGVNNWFIGARKDTIGGSSGTDRFNILYGASPFLTIATGGNVGIGTTSPSYLVTAATSADGVDGVSVESPSVNGVIRLRADGTNGNAIRVGGVGAQGNTLRFLVGSDAERMRIDSSGRLLVGTSTAYDVAAGTGYTPSFQVVGSTAQQASALVARTDGEAYIAIANLGGGSVVSNNEALGFINFKGNDSNSYPDFASIAAYVDGTPGDNDAPGRLVFSTTADGASSPTERMRITQAGGVRLPDVYNQTIALSANVFIDTDGTLKRATSSIKYKTNVETLEDQYADAVLNCRPVWYQSTSGGDNPEWGYWGFIAEEVAEIDPRLVQWKSVEQVINEDGSRETVALETPEPENVAYDRFVPHLLNLIKRQQQAIEDLQAEVAALKAQ